MPSWLVCGGMIVEKEGLDGPHFFLVPKSDAEVVDDWQTMALEGTGSKSFVVTDKFIPAHRFLDGRLSRAGTGPGTAVNKAAVYRVPRFGGVAAAGFSALAVGMARGVLAEWLADDRAAHLARRRGRRAAEHADPRGALRGRDRRRACALPGRPCAAACASSRRAARMSNAERLTGRRNVAFACQLALKAGTRLFNAAGGRALYLKGAMQRQYRNLLGAAAHRGVTWEASAAEYGAALLEQHGAPRPGPN